MEEGDSGFGPAPRPQPPDDGDLASIGQRIVARLVDFLLVGVPLAVFILLASDVDLDARVFDTPLWARAVSLLVGISYETFLTARFGQTLGKKLVQIEVLDETTGAFPSVPASAARVIPVVALSTLPLVGQFAPFAFYLPAIWRPRRRGLHDSLAHTVVVRTDRS